MIPDYERFVAHTQNSLGLQTLAGSAPVMLAFARQPDTSWRATWLPHSAEVTIRSSGPAEKAQPSAGSSKILGFYYLESDFNEWCNVLL